ncbi:MAG: hypothetical protein E7430_00290 [Ruminococcaceae bacterium]|nr:hypothetical protein [Oscillospiraceae bacterium]
MASLSEIIKDVEFSDVWEILNNRYDDADNYKEFYELIFGSMKAAKPYSGNVGKTLAIKANEMDFWYDDEDEPSLQAVGLVEGDDEYYAIGDLDPDQMAAIEVEPQTAADFSPADIAAYCIVEIMYFSSLADSAWGNQNNTAAKGLIDSSHCISSEMDSYSLTDYRKEMGLVEEEKDRLSEMLSGINKFYS